MTDNGNYTQPPSYATTSSPNQNYNYTQSHNPQQDTVGYTHTQNYNPQAQNTGFNAAPQPITSTGFNPEEIGTKLTEKTRIGFIRKVYLILFTQLFVTAAGVVFVFNSKGVYDFVYRNVALMFVAMALYVVCVIVLGCFRNVSRRVPVNYILLAVLTLAMTYMV